MEIQGSFCLAYLCFVVRLLDFSKRISQLGSVVAALHVLSLILGDINRGTWVPLDGKVAQVFEEEAIGASQVAKTAVSKIDTYSFRHVVVFVNVRRLTDDSWNMEPYGIGNPASGSLDGSLNGAYYLVSFMLHITKQASTTHNFQL